MIITATVISSSENEPSKEILNRKESLDKKIKELNLYFNRKRILVDENICRLIDESICLIYKLLRSVFTSNSDDVEKLKDELVKKLPELKKRLEKEFRQLLSTEKLNTKLEKKQ